MTSPTARLRTPLPVKPFATLGSEISKVRDRVRRGAESLSLHPGKVAPQIRDGVRDQRDRLLAKLGEQTFRLIAERKLQVPKVLQESVERLAALLGVKLPLPDDPNSARATAARAEAMRGASDPMQESPEVEPEPVPGRSVAVAADEVTAAPPAPTRPAKDASPKSPKSKRAKRRKKR